MVKLHQALDFCIHHQTILGYSIVSLPRAASEHIFSSVVFKCPCNSGNMLYGSVFLTVPAFILFLLGYVVNARTWCPLTGSCSPWETYTCYCFMLLPVTARALVAPLTWIGVALFRASFYECAASGSSLTKNLMCKADRMAPDSQHHDCGTDFNVSRCYSPVSYLRLKFWKLYLKKEWELFEIKAKKHATRLSEINLNCFFEASDPALFRTPSNEDWQKISFLYTFNLQEQYYSMIRKYVNTEATASGSGQEIRIPLF